MSEDDTILLGFKAGRCARVGETNRVEASPERGAVILTNEDGLLHFQWRNRGTRAIEEDLILFPGDAKMTRVNQSNHRIFVLKFSSSNQRHFFWMQEPNSRRDIEFIDNVNRLLDDPESTLTWNPPPDLSRTLPHLAAQYVSSSREVPAPAGAPATSAAASGSNTDPSAADLARVQELIASMGGNTDAAAALPELALTDILTPANLTPLFSEHPELISALFPHLPPDLPTPPSAESLQRIIHSPQFRAAVSNFDQALRTGLLGGLLVSLGLPESAGTGVEAFLKAIQEQADSGDSMQTD